MQIKREIRNDILALFAISLGGWLMHWRIHPVSSNPFNLIPFIFGIVNTIVVPCLMNIKKTVIIGYLINGVGVILGSIVMVHFSLAAVPPKVTISWLLLRTTFAYVAILIAKLFIAQNILKTYYPGGLGRFFTTIWWIKHFLYFTVAYCLGYLLGR